MSEVKQAGAGKVSNKAPGLWGAYSNQILSPPKASKMPGDETMPEDQEIAGRKVERQWPGAGPELQKKINQMQTQLLHAEDRAAAEAARQAEQA